MNDVPIDRQHLIPEVVTEVSDSNVEQLMQPIFDSIWNDPRSLSYMEAGEWARNR